MCLNIQRNRAKTIDFRTENLKDSTADDEIKPGETGPTFGSLCVFFIICATFFFPDFFGPLLTGGIALICCLFLHSI